MTARAAALLLVVLAGCLENELPALLDQPGEACRSQPPSCTSNDMVLECIDGVLTERACEETCAELGPAMRSDGCTTGPPEGCVCLPEPGACAPGSTVCESATQLGYCAEGQVWATLECQDLCAESLATPVSLGCEVGEDGVAACWCAAEP